MKCQSTVLWPWCRSERKIRQKTDMVILFLCRIIVRRISKLKVSHHIRNSIRLCIERFCFVSLAYVKPDLQSKRSPRFGSYRFWRLARGVHFSGISGLMITVWCGCHRFWMLPVVDAFSCGCCQLWMLLWMPPCGSPLIMQAISKCLTIVLDYLISNHSRDIARDYQLSLQKTQHYQASMAIVKSERLLREKLRMTNSKIYIVVEHHDKYHTYKSTKESNWPPPERELVSTPDPRSDHYWRWQRTHGHQCHRRPADFYDPRPRETQRMRKANQAEHTGDHAFAGRRTLTTAQNKPLLRRGLKGIKFPVIMWLGCIIGLQRGSWMKSGRRW